MKYFINILLLFCFISHGQTVKGVVSMKPLKGVGDDSELSDKGKEVLLFGFTYSNNKSLLELLSTDGTKIDTVEITDDRIKNKTFESIRSTIRPHLTYYYKDFKNNVYRLESERRNSTLDIQNLSIRDEIQKYDWKFINETQTINGFNCKKAITIKPIGSRSQNITAWYCEDIPISDGPMDFTGLPGLILKIEINNTTELVFESLKVLKDKIVDIQEPKNKSPLMTIDEYFKNF